MTDDAIADVFPQLLFDTFATEVDPWWRALQVSRHQEAIRRTVGDEQDAQSATWLSLQRQQQAVRAAQEACLGAARAVVGRDYAWPLIKPGHPLFDALSAAHAQALRAHVQMMEALGQLRGVPLQRAQRLLDNPQASDRDDSTVWVADVALLSPSGNEVLAGVMVLTDRRAEHDHDGPWGVLVYWPGAHGGVALFDSVAQFQQALLEPLADADADLYAQTTLSLAPISGHAFDTGLARQWSRLLAHADAIKAGQRLYADADSIPASLQRWRQEALATLCAPQSDARDQAFIDVLQENEGAKQADRLPAWPHALVPAQRQALAALVDDYRVALRAACTLLNRDVAPREAFVAQRLGARLQRDYAMQPEQLRVDMPVSVTPVREFISTGGTPGTPSKMVNTPSRARESVSLVTLALWGVDEQLATRLQFARVEGVGVAQGVRLPSVAELKALFAELDVAAQYERHLRDAFKGAAGEPDDAVKLRRDTLLAPWQASLRVQTLVARVRGRLDDDAVKLVENPLAQLYWVNFRPGSGPDGSSHATSLAGVLLIHDPATTLTVLHLPDTPNGKTLTQHAGLAEACSALARMALETGMVEYLASLPLRGNAADHAAHIRQALLKDYSGFVAPGERLHTAPSIAEQQLNLQMGRAIEQHRTTARSQDQLWLEAAAQGHGDIFVVIKVLVGLVPFVGTAVGLYDAFGSAMAAVEAFRRGRPGEGLDHIENLLAALVGAVMDMLPAVAAVGTATRVRSLVQARQNGVGAARRLSSRAAPSVRGSPFRGYESDVQPWLLRNATQGVYRHAGTDYIIRSGSTYAVQWDAAYRTWRLQGVGSKSYRQPVARDASGEWNTHGALYGRLAEGGLPGGGAVLTHIADSLVERLPLAVQQRLPRWLGDALVRDQRRVLTRLLAEEQAVTAAVRITEEALLRYHASPNDESLRSAAVRAATADVQACEQLLLSLVEQRARLSVNIQRDATRSTRYQAMVRMQNLIWLAKNRLRVLDQGHTAQQRAQSALIEAFERHEVALDRFMQQTNDAMRRGRELRIEMLEQLELIEQWSQRFEQQWQGAALDAPRRTAIQGVLEDFSYRYQPRLLQVSKSETLLKLVFNDRVTGSAERLELARLFLRDVRALNVLLSTWRDMGEVVNLSAAHRKRMLEQFVGQLEHFRWRLEEWTSAYPEHVDLRFQKRVLRHLKGLSDQAQADLARDHVPLRREQPDGGPRKRVFETVDDGLLIGTEAREDGTPMMRVDLEGGSTQHYELKSNGKWQMQEARAARLPMNDLRSQARVRLEKSEGLELRAEGYARRGMALASVDDLLGNEGRGLLELASHIEAAATAADDVTALVQHVRERGQQLVTQATTLRIRLSKASEHPTMGMVAYLLDQDQVRLERRGTRVAEQFESESFLQEYAVVDVASDEALWFAHFHYQKQRHAFDSFSAAHIKRAEQRLLGAQWEAQQASQGRAERVWRSPISIAQARQHFQALA